METVITHSGLLKFGEDCNDHETVFLNEEPIAEVLDYISGKCVTVRYYISDKEGTLQDIQEDFLINTLYGEVSTEYSSRYSEYSGYLWTDDNLKVGGHDLLSELYNYHNK